MNRKFLPLLLVSSACAMFAAGPDPAQVYVNSISYGGTGCPQGTVGTSLSNDRTSFTMIFDQFVASTGSGVPVTETRKACQVSLNVHIPPGVSSWNVVLTKRGYLQLPTGLEATVTEQVLFPKSSTGDDAESGDDDNRSGPQHHSTTKTNGPVARDYTIADKVSTTSQSCKSTTGSAIGVNVTVLVDIAPASSAQALTTVDSLDGKITLVKNRKSCDD